MDDRVTGRFAYSQDAERPGMLHGRVLRSHHPHARVLAVRVIDELPQGCVVLLPEDVADTQLYGCLVPDTPILARARRALRRRPRRGSGRADAARSRAGAELPRGRLRAPAAMRRRSRPPSPTGRRSCTTSTTCVARREPGRACDPTAATCCTRFRLVHGRGEAGFDEAEVIVEGEWECAGAAHAPLEPHAALAEWSDGRLTVWTGTQTPFNVRRELAGTFALDEGDVRVVSPPMGGSFGAKTFTRIEAIAAALARKAALPVRIVLPRDEVFVTLVRHPARFRVRLGARRDGTFVARRVWADWDTGAYADTGPNVAAKGGWAAVGPYRFDHVEVDSRCVYTNSPSAGAFRGYAATQAVWASEQCVDLLAERLGADPLELRLRNVLRDGDRFATGETMHDFHVAECLERVAERIGWSAGQARQGPLRRDEGHADAEPLRGPRSCSTGGASRSRARPPTSARGATRASGSSPRARSAATRRSSTRPASTRTPRPSTRARPRAARRT